MTGGLIIILFLIRNYSELHSQNRILRCFPFAR